MENIKNPEPENKEFTFYWDKFLPDVAERENFKSGHLEQLRILCSLYQDYHELREEIKITGMTYESAEGRGGFQIKVHPLIAVKDKMLAEIRQYSKLLKLVLTDDVENTKQIKDEDEWL